VAKKGDGGTLQLWPLKRDERHMATLAAWAERWQSGPEVFWDFDALIAMLARPICRGFIFAEATEADWVAVAFLDVGTYSADLLYIYVDPQSRGRHVGSQMLALLISHLQLEPELEDLLLEVRPSNQPAIKLYEKLGFQRVGERKRYYGNGEDALVFKLRLRDDSV
jgi:ribosomal-protein-alanine N-acetyltransferase